MIERIFCVGCLWMAVFAGLHFEILVPVAALIAWLVASVITCIVMAVAK